MMPDSPQASEPSFPAIGSARSLSEKIISAANASIARGEARCPFCDWAWVSSVDFRERHHERCPLPEARQVLNDTAQQRATNDVPSTEDATGALADAHLFGVRARQMNEAIEL